MWIKAGIIASAGAPFVQPYNYHLYELGDSRVQQGYSMSGTYGNAPTNGLQSDIKLGPAAMLGVLSGHKVRYGSLQENAGGAAQTVEEILAYPRSGSNSIDLTQVAANEAAIVVMYMGTNDVDTPNINSGGSSRILIQNAIAALTNPAATWTPSGTTLPLYSGLPKNIIFLAETPRGIAADGTTSNAPTQAAAFEAFSTWLKTFDYASGNANANSRVVVADTFHDPSILDVTSGTSWLPLPGLFADGLHPSPTAVYRMGAVTAARIAPLFTNPTPYAEVPTSSTASTFLNANPLLLRTGNPIETAIPTNTFISGDLFSPGTTILAFGTNGTSGSGGGGTYVLSSPALLTSVKAMASTSGSGSTVSTTQGSSTLNCHGNWWGTISAGATITGGLLPDSMRLGIDNTDGLTIAINVNTIDATNGNELVVRVTGTSGSNVPAISLIQTGSTAVTATTDMSTGSFRGTGLVKYSIANPNTLYTASLGMNVGNSAQNSLGSNSPLAGSASGYANQSAWRMNLKNNYVDLSSSSYATYTTGTVSSSGQSIPTATSPTAGSTLVQYSLGLMKSSTIDVTIYLRQLGVKQVSD